MELHDVDPDRLLGDKGYDSDEIQRPRSPFDMHVGPFDRNAAGVRHEHHPYHTPAEHRCKDWFDVKEGEASIFRPENGGYKVLARVQMDEWPRIALSAK